MHAIGIDLGASKVSAALVDKKMHVVASTKIMLEEKRKKDVLEKIFQATGEILEKSPGKKIKGIGIGVPAFFKNSRPWIFLNLRSMDRTDIASLLEKKFSLKAYADNDANCFALAEAKRLGAENLVGITIGTGFGGGIVTGGRIYRGNGSAAEFGHVSMFPDDRKCSCGNRGCIEEYVSGKALELDAKSAYGERINPQSLSAMARKGDGKAIKIFEDFGIRLGKVMANINFVLNPEIISIGGGISRTHSLFLPYAKAEMKRRSVMHVPKVVVGRTDEAPGAAMLVFQ